MARDELLLSNAVEWRWVDTDGSQQRASLAELRDHLTRAELPPFVLLWRPGWPDWIPAKYVPEVASALGEHADPQVPGALDVTLTEPPKPSLKDYVAAGQPLSKRFIERPAPAKAPPPKPKRLKPEPVRDVLPTLVEEPLVGSATSTLRPAAALPPPPRQKFPSRAPSFDDVDRGVPTLGEADLHENRSEPQAQDDSRVSTVPPRRSRSAPPASNLALGGIVVGVVLAVVAGVVVVNRRARVGAPTERPSTAAPASIGSVQAPSSAAMARPQPTGPGCVVVTSATPVAPSAYIGVPPIIEPMPEPGMRVAVGFAAEATRAVGLALDPTTLAFDQSFAQDHPGRILGVVPLPSAEDTAFAVDGVDSELVEQRTVSASRPFAIGLSEDGFSRRVGSTVTLIWPIQTEDSKITTPRVVEAPGVGYLVVFRQGGRGGKMLTGWLTPSGDKLTDLAPVPAEESMLGTPSAAVSEAGAVVTFSAKESGPDLWATRLARVPLRGAASESQLFEVPPGGPGQDAISAGAASLSGGRTLLQWTEGARDNRVVRATVLDADLKTVSSPITLSPPGEESGQGVVWSDGERIVVLFFVKKQRNHELWGVSLKCP